MRIGRRRDHPPEDEAEPNGPAMIVPVIKRAERPSGGAVSSSEPPIMEPLIADLSVGYALDLPRSFQYVSQRTCDEFGLEAAELRSLAVRNLTRRRPVPQIRQGPAGVGFVLDGDLEASLLLVDDLWDRIAPQLPGDLIAAVPARDVLMASGTDVAGGPAALSSGIERVWAVSNPRLRLTRSMLIRRAGAWHVRDG